MKIKALLFSLWLLPAAALAQDYDGLTDEEIRNLEVMRLWGEQVWGKGELELVDDLVAPKYIRHNAKGTRTVTPESYLEEIRSAMTRNTKFETHAVSVDGDLVWTRWSASGVQFDGTPFSNKGMQVYRLEGGKLVETWNLFIPGDPWE